MSNIGPRNLRHALKSVVPNWLSDRPNGLNVGFAVLFGIALIGDLLIEAMFQGLFAAWPGRGTNTSLPLIGQSRGFIRGLLQSDEGYVALLHDWLDIWPEAGSDEILLKLLQNYMGGNLKMRIIDRKGRFTTINADGTYSSDNDPSWNWDEVLNPERDGWWSDFWIIVYVTDGRWPVYTDLSDAAWLAGWGTVNQVGAGHQVPGNVPNDVIQIVSTFKGAHTWCQAIIFTNSTTAFTPHILYLTPIDGRQAHWSWEDTNDVGDHVQKPIRPTVMPSDGGYIRYWIPRNGA